MKKEYIVEYKWQREDIVADLFKAYETHKEDNVPLVEINDESEIDILLTDELAQEFTQGMFNNLGEQAGESWDESMGIQAAQEIAVEILIKLFIFEEEY